MLEEAAIKGLTILNALNCCFVIAATAATAARVDLVQEREEVPGNYVDDLFRLSDSIQGKRDGRVTGVRILDTSLSNSVLSKSSIYNGCRHT
eukprot:SAG31_NODE_6041_length_2196_cov_1.822604_2_plen_92_part_00